MESNSVPRASAKNAPRRSRTLLWQRFVLSALKGATKTIQRVPRRSALRFGAGLGRIAFRFDKRRRRYVDRNLRLAYRECLSESERDVLARRTFEHWGKMVVEFLRVSGLEGDNMDKLVAAVEGREWLEAARAKGGGLLIVSGHIGNFEFLGRWMASQGVPSTVIVRDPADPALADYLRRIREYKGNVALGKGAASVRALLTLLKQGKTVTLGVDQNSGDLFLPFFGMPTGTVAGPALLASRTGVPLLPAFCVLDPDDRYRLIILPSIEVTSTGDRDADVSRTMTEVNAALEGVVRRFPEQWLWLHNRWKSVFEEANRSRWPEGYDFDAALALWQQK